MPTSHAPIPAETPVRNTSIKLRNNYGSKIGVGVDYFKTHSDPHYQDSADSNRYSEIIHRSRPLARSSDRRRFGGQRRRPGRSGRDRVTSRWCVKGSLPKAPHRLTDSREKR